MNKCYRISNRKKIVILTIFRVVKKLEIYTILTEILIALLYWQFNYILLYGSCNFYKHLHYNSKYHFWNSFTKTTFLHLIYHIFVHLFMNNYLSILFYFLVQIFYEKLLTLYKQSVLREKSRYIFLLLCFTKMYLHEIQFLWCFFFLFS